MDSNKITWVVNHAISLFDVKTLLCLLYSSKHYRKGIIASATFHILNAVLQNGSIRLRKWFKQFLNRNKEEIDLEILKNIEKTYKISKNLLLNYQFKNKKENWKMGNQMLIEDDPQYKLFPELEKVQYVASGSYDMNEISQTVELPKAECLCTIQVGVYIARRFDCDCEASFIAEALNKNGEVVDKFHKSIAVGELKGYDPAKETAPYTFICGYIGSNASSVKITIENKDSKWWAGNYGARISHPFVRIIPM